ncbi:muscle M-line assembly protein unc-89-like isoform X1 [Cucurbita moschata]|uniref:Muscle M-line assembly protein unc-89-like isoform X1 n=1 Tax=Cucurbita moschata TaxID=3662 RepID=A0A6J1HAE5_CUCMO|nr:muscle M-line assembly protein unc-89-like isoform X1 [Cucurbita moschata]
MATQTQASTSDEQTKKFSEAVKVTEQIEETGKGENLATSEARAVDEPPVSERPSNEPIVGEATELPVIAFLEKGTKEEFDAADNKGEVIQKESLEVLQNVEEQASEIVGLVPKAQEESSVTAECGKAPADTEEEDKEADKEAQNKEAEAIEVVPMEEMIGTAEAPTPKEQAVDKELEEVIAKEISIPTEVIEPSTEFVSAEKEASCVVAESAETPLKVIAEDTTESITASKNKEQQNEEHPVVAGKSLVDLIAETKIEEPQVAGLEGANVSEVEVKDEQVASTKGEVPSNPTQKHSHNLLSKLKHSLVKARKAIIGKSPTSKTLSSQPRDDIKVK